MFIEPKTLIVVYKDELIFDKKNRTVQQVVVSGKDSIMKDSILEYDVKITIQYHSFGKKK